MTKQKPIRVYLADIKELENQELYQRLYPLVSKQRREKMDRLQDESKKRSSLAAELLLRRALADWEQGIEHGNKKPEFQYTEHGNKELEFQYTEHGKPYLDGIHFNLSHSEDRVMCVLSEKEVGCDVEKMAGLNLQFAKRFFAEQEYENICSKESEEERRKTFYRIWTLKESFMKATGLGMKLPLDSFAFSLENDQISVCQSVNREKYYFKEYDLQDGYGYAVCGLVPEFEEIEWVTLSQCF